MVMSLVLAKVIMVVLSVHNKLKAFKAFYTIYVIQQSNIYFKYLQLAVVPQKSAGAQQ